MTFLQPFILWGLPLVLLPVIIHLINRLRHRPQPWAAMRFLVSATRASTSHAKLRQFLILLFRVLAVLTLLLFLARPLAGGWMGWMLSPAPDVVVILLDRSASMETKIAPNTTKREQAIQLISQAGKQYEGATHFVLIDSALRMPQELPNAGRLSDFPTAQPTDTTADIPAMLQAALNYLVENHAGSAELWIASDLQRSNWQVDDARFKGVLSQLSALPQKIRVRLLALTQEPQLNAAVSVHELARQKRGDKGDLQFTLDLQRNRATAEKFPMAVTLDGSQSQLELTMDSQSMRWRHKLETSNKGTGWGSFELPADANNHDNPAYFVYGAEVSTRATVVVSDKESGKFLRLAAGIGAKNPKETVRLILTNDLSSLSLGEDSLLIWQSALPSGSVAEAVQQFVQEGGAAIFFPPGEADTQQFEGFSWGATQSADTEKVFSVAHWDQEQGPLAKTDEGASLPLPQTEFRRRQVFSGPKNILASFEDGVPFLTRQTLGRGEIYFCASLPEKRWSSLGDGPVLVPMIQRLLQSGSKRLQQVASVSVGELSAVDAQKQWVSVDSSTNKNIRLRTGVYRSGERLVAVNRSSAEDEPEVLDVNEAKTLFGAMSFQLLQDRQQRTDALQGEVWRFFLFGMLALLIGESILILPAKASSSGPETLKGKLSPQLQPK
ncbi:MAG: N-terminal double-transrane protein [Verrucomicrobiales bacterium]|nr:N-terminal double-transrane protein [Verrucomicrobiales bacterium]